MNEIRVSVITVCRDSEKTIRDTINSVLAQSYDNLEYIIIDGASTDRTMTIVHSYETAFRLKHIVYRYLSEPDEGIYDAMNKGIGLASGELVGFINSDDWYEPNAVSCAVMYYKRQLYDLFYADLRIVGKRGSFIKKAKDGRIITSRYWNHPTTFIPKRIYDKYQYRNENIHEDWDLILRLRKSGCRVCVVNMVLANFRRDGVSHEKSIRKAMERARLKYRIYRDNGYSRWYIIECYGIEAIKLLV